MVSHAALAQPSPRPPALRRCGSTAPERCSCSHESKTLNHHAIGPLALAQAEGQPAGAGLAPPIVNDVLRSAGRPLEAASRSQMQRWLGRDLGRIRIHNDAAAAASATSIGALAYTAGQHIVFGEGRYSASTPAGRRLLAHELVHTQQTPSDAPVPIPLPLGSSHDPAETEARDVAARLDDTAEPDVPHKIGGGASSVARVLRAEGGGDASAATGADAACRGYVAGEVAKSYTLAGHLDPHVWKSAPGRLVVADFGVDWRHLKSNIQPDPIFQHWLLAWESDDSYHLSIAGYSDCVGPESNNTDLRQGRARAVEELLGPKARGRVSFRGMAALGQYVTDNTTVQNRATNRSAVIEFEQEFTFKDEQIEANPLECGPDVTDWLYGQMRTNYNHPSIRTMRENRWPRYVPIFNIGWDVAALKDFASLVGGGRPWDFKSHAKALGWRNDPGHYCPTKPCDTTVTLCGMCFNYDVPGNIHFGWIGRAAELGPFILHRGADWAQSGQLFDDPKDSVAIDIGIAMMDDGADMCAELRTHHDELNLDKTAACDPCT